MIEYAIWMTDLQQWISKMTISSETQINTECVKKLKSSYCTVTQKWLNNGVNTFQLFDGKMYQWEKTVCLISVSSLWSSLCNSLSTCHIGQSPAFYLESFSWRLWEKTLSVYAGTAWPFKLYFIIQQHQPGLRVCLPHREGQEVQEDPVDRREKVINIIHWGRWAENSGL